jgi:hypothetical protein
MIMKLRKNFAICFMLALLGAVWAGCATHPAVTPLSSGYEEVSHPVRSFIAADDPQPPRVALQYRGTNGVITPVWPSLYGVGEVFHGDLAIFVGDKAFMNPDPVIRPGLFAVKAPELPLDLTEEVLQRWAKIHGKNLTATRNRFAMITPEETDNGLVLHLEFSSGDNWIGSREEFPDESSLQLDWHEVETMMHTVKTKGVPLTDVRWKTPYIGEKK